MNKTKYNEPHNHSSIGGKYLRNIVLGFNDGLVSTIALVAGLTGAGVGGTIIILAGVAEMVGAAISMALGTYLSMKSEKEYYEKLVKQEKKEMKEIPEIERKEVEDIYKARGFSGNLLKQVVDKICSDKKVWLKVMMEEELGFKEVPDNHKKASIVIFIAFIAGALIPITPFLLLSVQEAFITAVTASAIGLFVVGAAKTKITEKNWLKSGLETLAVGAIASIAAFYLGEYVSGIVM